MVAGMLTIKWAKHSLFLEDTGEPQETLRFCKALKEMLLRASAPAPQPRSSIERFLKPVGSSSGTKTASARNADQAGEDALHLLAPRAALGPSWGFPPHKTPHQGLCSARGYAAAGSDNRARTQVMSSQTAACRSR